MTHSPSDGKHRAVVLDCDGEPFLAHLVFATSLADRLRGLLGRATLEPGHGLYLAPCRAVHTIGMRFALDLIFIDRDWRVHRVYRDVGPGRMVWGGWKAQGVLEIAASGLTGRYPAPGAHLTARDLQFSEPPAAARAARF